MSVVEVPLSGGYVALIDAADAEQVLAYKWSALVNGRTVYAVRYVRRADGRQGKVRLHTFLTGYAKTDHANGDGLDNRRANLRRATSTENNRNRRLRSDNTSGYKGVRWRRSNRKWSASITLNGRQLSLGCFVTAEEAAQAYDAAARRYFGTFAALNFPTDGERAA